MTSEKMKNFQQSKDLLSCKSFLCRTAKRTLVQNQQTANETEICDTRAMLTIQVACENGQRAGAVAGMMMTD